jgi:hypothetical protein
MVNSASCLKGHIVQKNNVNSKKSYAIIPQKQASIQKITFFEAGGDVHFGDVGNVFGY